jgi:hypothetical protein
MTKKKTTNDTRKRATPTALVHSLAEQATAGWTATTAKGYYGMDDAPFAEDGYWFVKFERIENDVRATVALNVTAKMSKWDKKRTYRKLLVAGHTFVNGGCFTRRGVDCESVELMDATERFDHQYGDVASMLDGEWARCVRVVEARKTSEPVPGTPFSQQPAWFLDAANQLRAGRTVTLTPHGFGTGYTLSTRLPRNRYGRGFGPMRAPAALEQRLGVEPIYIDTFDHD